jgi:predicted TIM-barrel fold metal-dependent hydrolase
MIIDAHTHIGETPYVRRSADDVVREMDAAGVDRAVVCPMGAHLAVRNRDGNDLMAASVAEHPDRLVGFLSVNPWWGPDAVRELDRAAQDLGLSGVKLHPVTQGFHVDDEIALPVVERAVELGLPIYIHSGTPVLSLPLAILELASRYPEGRFILGHMGGADFFVDIPMSFGRASNVWVETSLTCHAGYVGDAVAVLGAGRVLFGSDSPTSAMASELTKIRVLGLDADAERKILGGNVAALLNGGRPQ